MKALICDDDRMARRLFTQVLSERGHDVTEVDSGEQALAACARNRFELLLIDWVLPQMDGLQLTRALRTLAGGDEPVIIVLTGRDKEEHIRSALDAGADDYINKPVDRALLSTRLTIAERSAIERTQRKLVGQRLANLEISFRKLIEESPDVIIVHRAGRIEYVNRAVLSSLGYASEQQLIGRSYETLLHPDELEVHRSRMRELARTDEPTRPLKQRFMRMSGESASVEVVSLQLDFAGKPAMVTVGRDLSERERTEKQLFLADRMASVGTLAAGMAHEINNPLAYVMTNLELMHDALHELGKQLPEGRLADTSEMLAQAEDGAERVRRIVRDLKTFSRGDDEARDSVDIRRVMNVAIRMAWNEIRHRARLVKDFGSVPPVTANEAKLGQVFLNVLINAVQSLPVGDADHNTISVRARQVNKRVVVSVTDTGCGMSPQVIERVFDPFFTTKPVGVGTGLGLSICHNIINALGGDISIQSDVGRGSTIQVSLPLAATQKPQENRPRALPSAPNAGARILIVDDEVGVAKALQRALRDHHVTIALSGREAIRRLREGPAYDLVFCDLMMPDLSGMDLYENTRKSSPGLERRMIFMTGGAFTNRARIFLETVPNPWFEKPFDIHEVRDLVRSKAA
ncbi:MAG: response regulator [Proteobacteria bacterium]|nr:response regulator [Pseudomonadota bacterium]